MAQRWCSHGHHLTAGESRDFPECSQPADVHPQDSHCDQQQFKNYLGVDEQAISDSELQAHLEKGHVVVFDTFEELSDSVDGTPILNKIGLVLKTRNGVANARMILDMKQSGVKHATSQAQRVIPVGIPRRCRRFRFGIPRRVLADPDSSVGTKIFCATGLINGK